MTALVTVQTPRFTCTVPELFAFPMHEFLKVFNATDQMAQFTNALELFMHGLPADKYEEFRQLDVLSTVAVIEAWLKATAAVHQIAPE